MKASEIIEVMQKMVQAKLPLFLWGSPGIGKSSLVKAVAEKEGMVFLDLRLSLLDPTDLKGIPFFQEKTQEGVWAKPSFLPSDSNSRGILFLDEMNSAPPAVQASAYQLILDRAIGEYQLPKGWSIVAAGNLESDRGIVYKMPPPLANRFVHLQLDVDFQEWKQWAYEEGIESSIIAYLSYDPSMLFTFEKANPKEKAFATPRSWSYVDRLLKSHIPTSLLLESLSGAIGREASVGYLSFQKVMESLPCFDAILSGDTLVCDASEGRVLMAIVVGLVNALRQSNTPKAVDNVLQYALSMPSEYSILLIKDMQQNRIDIESSLYWEEWVEKYAYLLS